MHMEGSEILRMSTLLISPSHTAGNLVATLCIHEWFFANCSLVMSNGTFTESCKKHAIMRTFNSADVWLFIPGECTSVAAEKSLRAGYASVGAIWERAHQVLFHQEDYQTVYAR